MSSHFDSKPLLANRTTLDIKDTDPVKTVSKLLICRMLTYVIIGLNLFKKAVTKIKIKKK